MSKAPAVPQARRHQLSTVATHTKQKQLLQPTGCSSCNCWLFESKNITFHCFKQIKGLFNTPGTAGGPGGRDRTLAVKSRKTAEKSVFFFVKKKKLPQKITVSRDNINKKFRVTIFLSEPRYPKKIEQQSGQTRT